MKNNHLNTLLCAIITLLEDIDQRWHIYKNTVIHPNGLRISSYCWFLDIEINQGQYDLSFFQKYDLSFFQKYDLSFFQKYKLYRAIKVARANYVLRQICNHK